jgi:hypothetical protein
MTKIQFLPRAQERCKIIKHVRQKCTNRGHQVAVATKFCTEAPNVCGTEWNLLQVALLSPRGTNWQPDF